MPKRKTNSASLRKQLLDKRYLLKDKDGQVIETPKEMFKRVAKAVVSVERKYGANQEQVQKISTNFFEIMEQGKFLPNSPTLMNAGRSKGMLNACFVLGIEDSIEGIFETVKRMALVQKAGGGTGFTFDTLRPTGDIVSSSGGQTSGPMTFWRVLSEASMAIQQGAHRRGANMAMLSVEHPDILKFIEAKKGPGKFSNFNISIKITDSFMETLQSKPDKTHVVSNPRTGHQYLLPRSLNIDRYRLQDLLPAGQNDRPFYRVRQIWDLLVTNAHASGEPGICFIDQVNRDNTTPAIGRIEATNPCGEQMLLNEEACCLGSIDISKFILPDGTDMDWHDLGDTIHLGVRFLDNIIDANHYPIPEIAKVTKGNRKIGLGIMGFADALVLMSFRYDSKEAINFAGKLSKFIQERAHKASEELAEERGTFPNWENSGWNEGYKRPMRNASCTTIAPTGSLSILAECSPGIEPIYSLAYKRKALDGKEFVQVHPLLEKIGPRDGWMSQKVREALLEGVPVTQIQGIPRKLAETLVTAHKVSPEWHVRIQAAFQENTDNVVSKTVNLPADAPVDEVDRVFRLAFKLGCKGITIYRDGSRPGQTFSATKQKPNLAATGTPRPRVRVTSGQTFKFRMGCGTLFVTVNQDKNGLCEVFSNLGKAGGCPSQSEATCRAISVALRSGVSPVELIEQLRGIRCLSTATARKSNSGVDVLSCPDAIARAIEEAMGNPSSSSSFAPLNICPDCGSRLRKEEGCLVCSCGFSKCW